MARHEDKRAAQRELMQQPAGARQRESFEQEDNEKAIRQEAMQQPAGEMRQQEGGAVIGRQKDKREAWREDERAA